MDWAFPIFEGLLVLDFNTCNILDLNSHPILELDFSHCVLYLNLIKSMLNTCILNHTHTSIDLSIEHGIIYPKP